ncbi:MAG: hypothetical protein WAZ40_01505 [Minisyncoccia bacterium]
MADHPEAPDTLFRDISIIVGIFLFFYVSNNIISLNSETVFSGEAPKAIFSFLFGNVPVDTIQSFFASLEAPLVVTGMIFLAGAFWATLKGREIHHHEEHKYAPIKVEEVTAKEKSIQWEVILEHVNSESPAEWKIAILEADNMLDEVLEDMGYTGDTLAEKLKGMSKTKIASYQDMWDGHVLRNQIAHGGGIDMDLSKKLARDTVAKYGNAFKELGYL